MRVAINKTEYFEPYLNDDGVCIDSNSTETNLLVTKCLPLHYRKKRLQNALDEADLENDELFVQSFEALTGLSKYYDI